MPSHSIGMVVAEGRGRNVDQASVGLLSQLIICGDSDRRPWLYSLVIDGESLAFYAGGALPVVRLVLWARGDPGPVLGTPS
jgi:hypothetical protein